MTVIQGDSEQPVPTSEWHSAVRVQSISMVDSLDLAGGQAIRQLASQALRQQTNPKRVRWVDLL